MHGQLATMRRYVDYLLVMAYNYHGSWNKFTGHHAGLFPRSDEVAGEREWNQVMLHFSIILTRICRIIMLL